MTHVQKAKPSSPFLALLAALLFASCESVVVTPEPTTVMPPVTNELIISEWACSSTADADGFRNTYFEIYNGTGAAVDLSGYGALYRRNDRTFGGEVGDTLIFSGTIENAQALVIARPEADPSIIDADFLWAALNANGDDAVALCTISGSTFTILDLLGDETRPSPAYDVAGVDNATRDRVLLRKYAVMNPNTDWTASRGSDSLNSEWMVFEKEYYFNAGKPTPNP
ncbi:MAG: hypothetical protein GC205_13250 [Bacteroidetes bacterium]|nr:hypothetical protein [Bacteroidota bacterium]